MTDGKGAPPGGGTLIDLAARRREKAQRDDLARGRKPLYVSHGTGKIEGSPHMKRRGDPVADFDERLARIRMSLAKVNELMAALRETAKPEIEREESK